MKLWCNDAAVAMAWYDTLTEEQQKKFMDAYSDKIAVRSVAFSFESFILINYNVALKVTKKGKFDMQGNKK